MRNFCLRLFIYGALSGVILTNALVLWRRFSYSGSAKRASTELDKTFNYLTIMLATIMVVSVGYIFAYQKDVYRHTQVERECTDSIIENTKLNDKNKLDENNLVVAKIRPYCAAKKYLSLTIFDTLVVAATSLAAYLIIIKNKSLRNFSLKIFSINALANSVWSFVAIGLLVAGLIGFALQENAAITSLFVK